MPGYRLTDYAKLFDVRRVEASAWLTQRIRKLREKQRNKYIDASHGDFYS